jgi:hypothetical protein
MSTSSSRIENGRRRTNDLDVLASIRMGKADLPGMQEIAAFAGPRGKLIIVAAGTGKAARTIKRVAHEGKSRVAEVNADLMGTPVGMVTSRSVAFFSGSRRTTRT